MPERGCWTAAAIDVEKSRLASCKARVFLFPKEPSSASIIHARWEESPSTSAATVARESLRAPDRGSEETFLEMGLCRVSYESSRLRRGQEGGPSSREQRSLVLTEDSRVDRLDGQGEDLNKRLAGFEILAGSSSLGSIRVLLLLLLLSLLLKGGLDETRGQATSGKWVVMPPAAVVEHWNPHPGLPPAAAPLRSQNNSPLPSTPIPIRCALRP